jgi:tetratricopeptide (TPR) repeat protein
MVFLHHKSDRYMQEFLHTNHDEAPEDIDRFEKMVAGKKELYFDVHQIENIFEFYLDNDKYEKADRILQLGLRQHPSSTSLLLKQASVLSDQGRVEEAQDILDRLTSIEYSNADVFVLLGWNYFKKNDLTAALDNFHKALSLARDEEEELLFDIGFTLSQEGAYSAALPFLEKVYQKFKVHDNLLFELAFVYDKLGFLEKSIQVYNELLDVNPFSENGWYNLGILYNKIEDYERAVQAYEFTITINPLHPEAHFNLGNSLTHNGLYKEALEAYHEHVSLSEDVLLTYQYIADCWEQLGEYKMAIRYYQLITQRDKNLPDAWYGLGTAFMGIQEFQKGIQAIDQAISIDPVNSDYWFAHARGLFELKKIDDAARSLENGINIDPEETAAWIELLRLKLLLDPNYDLDEFLKDAQNKYEDSAAVLYLGAFIHYKYFKDIPQAKDFLSKAVEIQDDDLQILLQEFPTMKDVPELKEIIDTIK